MATKSARVVRPVDPPARGADLCALQPRIVDVLGVDNGNPRHDATPPEPVRAAQEDLLASLKCCT
eukprot:8233602-Lingulodinium_polyedra.AAC.1